MLTYEIISRHHNALCQSEQLLRLSNGDRMTLVWYSEASGQVFNAMPNDAPLYGGRWFAGLCDKGIDYVAKWYHPSTVRKHLRRLIREYDIKRNGE